MCPTGTIYLRDVSETYIGCYMLNFFTIKEANIKATGDSGIIKITVN